MEKISEMIKRLCPEGVVQLRLGDVCTILNGYAFQSKKYIDEGYRVIRISDVQSGYISDKDKVYYPCDLHGEFKRQELFLGDLVMSLTGNPGRVALIGPNDIPCALNQRVACLRALPDKCITKYLFYTFNCLKFEEIAFANSNGGGQKNLSTTWLSNYEIPLPPLSIQQEIVRVLDSFTAMITNLETELASRQKQYEHYRNQLLTFDENAEGVVWKTISEVADNYTGLTYKPENIASEGTLVLRSSNIQDYRFAFDDNVFVSEIKIPERAIAKKGDILVCVRNGSRALVGKCAMITQEASGMAFGAFMTVLRCKDINNKYLFYVWQTDKVVKQYKGDEAMPINQITSKDFSKIIIPVVSIEYQREIVSTLDAFESLIANIKRELEARKKQYEYYREKLLTFE